MASAIDTSTFDAARAGSLYNEDLAPVSLDRRKWGLGSFAALWISMSACIPTYMLASSLIGGGMNWWEAILTVFLGNLIVLVPMVLNAHAGTKYGIPFPVFCRASFGTRGANLPALLRALVACGWFGIQTWIGGSAIYKILAIWYPGWKEEAFFLGINRAVTRRTDLRLLWRLRRFPVAALRGIPNADRIIRWPIGAL